MDLIEQFIQDTNLQPGDVVVAKKKNFRLLNHFMVYLGYVHNEPTFMANYKEGTQVIPREELYELAQDMEPTQIRKFQGNALQRRTAVQRAINRLDTESYHLILHNCEHFANFVQTGKMHSPQAKVFGAGLTATGLITAGLSENKQTRNAGFVMAGLGLLTILLDEL